MEPIEQIESAIAFYDQCEVYHNCTVQVLTNTKTGDVSVGWWRNGPDDDEEESEPC